MGKVKYATGIDYVSGSLSKPKVKNGHSCGTYLIGTHRVAATENPNCTRLFIRDAETYKRTTPVGPDELAARARFKAVRSAVYSRAHSLTTLSQDQAAYQAQLNTAEGKKTFNAYLWQKCGEEYDAQH
jgi:hypothetical protein